MSKPLPTVVQDTLSFLDGLEHFMLYVADQKKLSSNIKKNTQLPIHYSVLGSLGYDFERLSTVAKYLNEKNLTLVITFDHINENPVIYAEQNN